MVVELLVQLGDFEAHANAQGRIKVRQRLVKQEGRRFADNGAADGNPLTLTTRQLARLAIQIVGQVQRLGGGLDPLVLLGLDPCLAIFIGKAMFLRTDICG